MDRSTHIVTDLGFGDAGKGTMVDAIARRCSSPPLVVRHNGGAQAGHNVIAPDGRHHTFSQFGAATFVPGSRTLLSKHMVLHPTALINEWCHLDEIGEGGARELLSIDSQALVITPYHQAMNRIREKVRAATGQPHGTCGMGVGETVYDSHFGVDTIRAEDLDDVGTLTRRLKSIRERKLRALKTMLCEMPPNDPDLMVLEDDEGVELTARHFERISRKLHIIDTEAANEMIREAEHVIFEGAQGVLLDEWVGFHPHTTWSTTTSRNAEEMFWLAKRDGPMKRLGVVRSYATRHGAGPFPSESEELTQRYRDAHNSDACAQGKFRVGHFDLPLTKYATSVSKIDGLVVTHMDRCPGTYIEKYDDPSIDLRPGNLVHQERLGKQLAAHKPEYVVATTQLAERIAECLGVPLVAQSFGPKAEDKVWAR